MDPTNVPNLNILSAYPVFKQKYGLTMAEDDFIEAAFHALKDINSIPVKYYKQEEKPTNKDEMIVNIPCNLNRILSVSVNLMVPNAYTEYTEYRGQEGNRDGSKEYFNVLMGNSTLKTYHFNDTPFVPEGTYIQYEWVDSTAIRIQDKRLWDTKIQLLYEGVATDVDGLPLITRKHANAIAAKVALQEITKSVFAGTNPNAANVLPLIQQEAARLTQAAAIPEYINDNQLDDMLNEHTNFNRKTFNRSYKFRR